MELFKSFVSHVLAIIFFFALLYFIVAMMSKELINHDNIYNTLKDSKIVDNEIKNNNALEKANIPKELIKYIDIDDILYDYITNDILYEASIIDKKPSIDLKKLNSRVAKGLEKYIDAKIEEYSGEVGSLLADSNIDLKFREKAERYVEEKIGIDLSDDKIISEDDLENIYSYAEESVNEMQDAFNIIKFLKNKNYFYTSIVVMIVSIILIGIINFNIINIFAYTISPFAINSIFCLLLYIISSNLNFKGGSVGLAINSFKGKLESVLLRYFIILLVISIVIGIVYYIIKHLNIAISHKKGVATLDTVLDDYNRDDIVKEINKDKKEDAENKGEKQ